MYMESWWSFTPNVLLAARLVAECCCPCVLLLLATVMDHVSVPHLQRLHIVNKLVRHMVKIPS